jgi:hypothetical protein
VLSGPRPGYHTVGSAGRWICVGDPEPESSETAVVC